MQQATSRRDDTDRSSHIERRYRALVLELTRHAQRSTGGAETLSDQTFDGEVSQQGRSPAFLLRLRVRGGSMVPLLRPGDVVWVEPVTPSALKRGDLIVVQRQGTWVTHRLVARQGGKWQVKGDNLRHPDPPVTDEAVLGRVVAIERDGLRIDLRELRWQLLNRVLGWIGWVEVCSFAMAQRWKHRLFRGRVPPVLRVLAGLATALPRRVMQWVLRRLDRRMGR